MTDSPVNVILDGDMLAYSNKVYMGNNTSSNPTHNLPPLPLWSCMVDGTMNFCRLICELYKDSKISVTVAGDTPVSLVDWRQPNERLEKLQYNFQRYRPTESTQHDHILETFRSSFNQLLPPKPDANVKLKTGHIVFVTISKGPDEGGYNYRVNVDGILKDFRAMLFKALPIDRMVDFVANLHIDILRVVPTSVPDQIPTDILQEQIAPGVTFSIYNVPNGKSDLTRAMVHLAQLQFNIDCLHIREKSNSIEYAECYYTTPVKKRHPRPSIRLFDSLFGAEMTEHGLLLKKENGSISDLNVNWCSPYYMGTFLKHTMDEYTNKLQAELWNGAHFYILSNPEMESETAKKVNTHDKLWNRVLLFHKGKLVLQDVNHDLDRSMMIDDNVTVKQEGQEVKQEFQHQLLSITNHTQTIKAKEFIDKLVRPNTYQDLADFMKQTAATNSNTILTADYDTQLYGPSHTQTKMSKCTMAMERQTKFQTCVRDGQAYTSTDFDLQHLDLFRSPSSAAFGVSPQGLLGGMFEELEEALVSDDDIKSDTSMKNLVDMMVVELFNAKRNKPNQRLFPKSAGKEMIPLLATKSLVSLYLVGKRFKNDSSRHRTICQRILDDITVQNEWSQGPPQDDTNEAINSNNKRQHGIDKAWDQAKRYKSMTHREKEEARMHDTPPPPSPQQQHVTVNPLFRGRRHAPDVNTNPQQTYPDPSIAIPYLHIPPPEKPVDDVNPGPHNSLLAQFWSAHQHRMKTIKDFDGRKLRYQTGD